MLTPNRGIPYVPENTLDPAAGLNDSLNVIDALLQTAVISMGEAAPPMSPQDGDMHIVGSGTGAWAGQDDNLARYVAEGAFWQFYQAGVNVVLVLNLDDGGLYAYAGSSGWMPAIPGSGAPMVVTEGGTNLDATSGNSGNYTRFTNDAPKTYNFSDSEDYVVGAEYHGRNTGSGYLTLTPDGGFTLNPPAGGSLEIPQDGTFTVKIVAEDEADVFGVTVPQS